MISKEIIPSPTIGPIRTKTYPQLVYVVLINEILPRVKKNKLSLEDFPPEFCKILCMLEYDGRIDRKKHREFLDDHMDWVKRGRPQEGPTASEIEEYIVHTCTGQR